jgi:transaldolase
MKTISELKIKLFADGADKAGMLEMYQNPFIKGFTTNPTLMRKAGITNYVAFAKDILSVIQDRPVSFEVFSDDFMEMKRQALLISSWGNNVYVKIPVMNTEAKPCYPLIKELADEGVKLNITAIMTFEQIKQVSLILGNKTPSIISVFAGRIADTGVDPVPMMKAAVDLIHEQYNQELLWASPRELLNIFQADQVGCHIITATNDVLHKMSLVGKDLTEYSLDTVKMFRNDAVKAGYEL